MSTVSKGLVLLAVLAALTAAKAQTPDDVVERVLRRALLETGTLADSTRLAGWWELVCTPDVARAWEELEGAEGGVAVIGGVCDANGKRCGPPSLILNAEILRDRSGAEMVTMAQGLATARACRFRVPPFCELLFVKDQVLILRMGVDNSVRVRWAVTEGDG